ncbi:hypothetical protein NC653_024696 [Populus alba x Populus x berolinensis]|uniref:Uncharacterized protein n=1 Tax=Populus alba x Populus x berolinensis TaxID=444605 RepID=A0AAD6MA08_9ROSI|nr:hypothetical protein NC653_024696 [Populus alba x Populus x berolinensis]
MRLRCAWGPAFIARCGIMAFHFKISVPAETMYVTYFHCLSSCFTFDDVKDEDLTHQNVFMTLSVDVTAVSKLAGRGDVNVLQVILFFTVLRQFCSCDGNLL